MKLPARLYYGEGEGEGERKREGGREGERERERGREREGEGEEREREKGEQPLIGSCPPPTQIIAWSLCCASVGCGYLE